MRIKKGTALIVGKEMKKSLDYIETDGVVIYDAYCVSNRQPQLIDNAIIPDNSTDVIYVCGHGDRKKRTIDGRGMDSIAHALVEKCHYTGKQTVCILSCYSMHKNPEKDMAYMLGQSLKLLLGREVNVVSKALNTSVLFRDYNRSSTRFYDVKLSGLFKVTQPTYLWRHKIRKIKLSISKYSSEIQAAYEKCCGTIKNYNKDLALRGGSNIQKFKRFLSAALGLIFSVLLIIPIIKGNISFQSGITKGTLVVLGMIVIASLAGVRHLDNLETWTDNIERLNNLLLRVCLVGLFLLTIGISGIIIQFVLAQLGYSDGLMMAMLAVLECLGVSIAVVGLYTTSGCDD